MKKIFVLCMLASVSFVGLSQTDSPVINDFIPKYENLKNEYHEKYDSGKYDQTELVLKEILDLIENLKLSENEISNYQATVDMLKASTYYDLACCYSLRNRKKEAIDAFEKSVESGYSNYRHAKKDNDLDNIRKEKRFTTLLDKIKGEDVLVLLQKSGNYQKEDNDSLPKFTYQSAENDNLKEVKKYFNLDSVAGNDDEISKILNILNFIHNAIKHSGANYALCEFDAIDLYNYHKATGKGVNCRHLAIALNEMYLSVGIKSRYVTCIPKDPMDPDCHVINSVYSEQLQKWIWIDPTFNAYVKDENGNFLGIAEVRERLKNNMPLVLNEDANWNNENKQTKEHYLDDYMTKNLYWFACQDYSRFNPESRYRNLKNNYIVLLPLGFENELPEDKIDRKLLTHDSDYFWQAPEK